MKWTLIAGDASGTGSGILTVVLIEGNICGKEVKSMRKFVQGRNQKLIRKISAVTFSTLFVSSMLFTQIPVRADVNDNSQAVYTEAVSLGSDSTATEDAQVDNTAGFSTGTQEMIMQQISLIRMMLRNITEETGQVLQTRLKMGI